MKKLMMLFAICLISSLSKGQVGLIPGANDPSKADLKVLTENRSVISTTIRPMDGNAEGYFLGTDEGSMDVNDLKLFIAGLKKQTKAVFRVENPQESHYSAVVTPAKATAKHKERKIRTRSKDLT